MQKNNLTQYRMSTYCYVHSIQNGTGLLMSTKTGSLCFISNSDFRSLQSGELEHFPEQTSTMLQKYNMLTTLSENEEISEYEEMRWCQLRNNLDVTIFLTLQCNSRCIYCFEEGVDRAATITYSQIDDFISWIKEKYNDGKSNYKTISICFHGGEPLLVPEMIHNICDQISKLGIKPNYSIVTNGTCITDKIVKLFKLWQINRIMITIDGDKVTHDHQRPLISGESSYESILSGLSAMRRIPVSNRHLEISLNLSPQYNNAVEGFTSSLDQFKDIIGQVTVSTVTNYNHLTKDEVYNTNEWAIVHCKAIFYLLEHGFDVTAPVIPQICPLSDTSSFILSPSGFGAGCVARVGRENGIENNHRIASLHHNKCCFFPICGGGCPSSPSDRCLSDYYNFFMPTYLDSLAAALQSGRVAIGQFCLRSNQNQ